MVGEWNIIQNIRFLWGRPTHQFLETILEEGGHGAVQMSLDSRQTVTFVGIYLLFVEHALAGQSSGQNHRLLDMDVVVGGAMNQQELTLPQIVHIFGEVALLVALVVVRHVGETEIPFGVSRVCNERMVQVFKDNVLSQTVGSKTYHITSNW